MSPSPVGLSRQIRVGERREDRVGQGGDIPRRHEAPEGGSRRGCEDFGYAAGVRGNDRDTPSQRLNDDLAKGLRGRRGMDEHRELVQADRRIRDVTTDSEVGPQPKVLDLLFDCPRVVRLAEEGRADDGVTRNAGCAKTCGAVNPG